MTPPNVTFGQFLAGPTLFTTYFPQMFSSSQLKKFYYSVLKRFTVLFEKKKKSPKIFKKKVQK
jgi:hypothetical protein